MYRKLKVNNGVYTLTNTKNGKKYIGYSDNLRDRIAQHFQPARKHREDFFLQKDIRKYYKKSFKLDIIYSVDDYKDIDKLREIYLDLYLNNKEEYQYNIGIYKDLGEWPDEFIEKVKSYYDNHRYQDTIKHFKIPEYYFLEIIKGIHKSPFRWEKPKRSYYKLYSSKYNKIVEGSFTDVSKQIQEITGIHWRQVGKKMSECIRGIVTYSFKLMEYERVPKS